jgi:hypothetical protein
MTFEVPNISSKSIRILIKDYTYVDGSIVPDFPVTGSVTINFPLESIVTFGDVF